MGPYTGHCSAHCKLRLEDFLSILGVWKCVAEGDMNKTLTFIELTVWLRNISQVL